jgi:hypothetical protein
MKRWLASWSISEDEPTWAQVIVAGLVFVLLMIAFPMLVLLVGAAMDVLP